jgi:serine protease Do
VPVQLLHRDVKNDLALLSVEDAPTRRAFLSVDPKPGEEIVVYGFPPPGGLSSGGNATTGNIAALSGIRDDSRLFQITAPVQPGISGGPVLDRGGAVVGIVVSKLDALVVAAVSHDIPQTINFVLKGSLVAAHVKAHNVFQSPPAARRMQRCQPSSWRVGRRI